MPKLKLKAKKLKLKKLKLKTKPSVPWKKRKRIASSQQIVQNKINKI